MRPIEAAANRMMSAMGRAAALTTMRRARHAGDATQTHEVQIMTAPSVAMIDPANHAARMSTATPY